MKKSDWRRGIVRAAFVAALLSSTALVSVAPAFAQSSDDEVVVTGTRVANRSALSTAAPVDVIGADVLNSAGVTELNQGLSIALPSYTFPRPGLADGTDTVRPASMRGLSPDQTLVLVNSKRRHPSALVNANQTVGRGASAVDLNTIPSAAVGSVQVLRDGASAQYGSDAIAGVINILLREAREGGNVSVTYGERITTVETPLGAPPAGANWSVANQASRDVQDGETLTIAGWAGLPLGDQGFVTISAEYVDQGKTVRTAADWRQQYPLVAGAFDPREATINRLNAWYGEPELQQYTLFGNAGYDLNNGVELYGWASYQFRDSVSAGFFRRALDERNVISIYPNGFLPLIHPEVTDYSAAGGARWQTGGWDMDASLGYGFNEMSFTIENTLNRSIGPSSKTSFDAGGFNYDQLVFNVSAVRGFDAGLASPLNFALGLEARRESYSIFAGEPDSYRNGGVLLPLNTTGCTAPTPAQILAGGCAAASGAQVFPGFRPSNVVDEDRTSIGAFVDVEANFTEQLLLSAAVRYENYSDFGETLSGKLAARYDFTDWFALRASVQNGFRAPSLQQQFFTATSTNFIDGIPFDITTFPATDPVAAALGARPLEAEDSTNYAVGAVFRWGAFNITIDGYRIEINNRIVLSENLTSAAVRNYLTGQGFIGIGGGRFFINGVDTVTEGVDIVANYGFDTDNLGTFSFTLGANFNSTDVTRVPTTAPLSALSPPPVLFDRINILSFERGTPRDRYSLNVNWDLGRFGATARATRYGEMLSPGTSAATDLVLEPRTLIDLEGRFAITEQVRFAIGADNVTDEYPTASPPSINTTSNTPFSNYAPFGRSGRYVYGRISYSW
ncbi:MAG: TonB-dependent receptor [Hyphomonadaceae bacterium]|nr:TonB-dependent receptor [Hyphomonadaceae bacterium]